MSCCRMTAHVGILACTAIHAASWSSLQQAVLQQEQLQEMMLPIETEHLFGSKQGDNEIL